MYAGLHISNNCRGGAATRWPACVAMRASMRRPRRYVMDESRIRSFVACSEHSSSSSSFSALALPEASRLRKAMEMITQAM
jgi:hypothetical protein